MYLDDIGEMGALYCLRMEDAGWYDMMYGMAPSERSRSSLSTDSRNISPGGHPRTYYLWGFVPGHIIEPIVLRGDYGWDAIVGVTARIWFREARF